MPADSVNEPPDADDRPPTLIDSLYQLVRALLQEKFDRLDPDEPPFIDAEGITFQDGYAMRVILAIEEVPDIVLSENYLARGGVERGKA